MTKATWTPEQLENIVKYGKCTICGEPRQREVIFEDGKLVRTGLTCPNGHMVGEHRGEGGGGVIEESYEDALELYADSEFCWNCAALLDQENSISVTISSPEKYVAAHRECCSKRCAARATDIALEPERSVTELRA